MNPYENCLNYETESFILRLVEPEDAKDLLVCYSDPNAVSRMNADKCTSDFYYTTLEQMQECIDFWLKEYQEESFVRLSIIPKVTRHAVGTVEIFNDKFGVLRIDLASPYEKEKYIKELLNLAVCKFVPDFEIQTLVIKASNTPERIAVLKQYDFKPSQAFRPGKGYYERSNN